MLRGLQVLGWIFGIVTIEREWDLSIFFSSFRLLNLYS